MKEWISKCWARAMQLSLRRWIWLKMKLRHWGVQATLSLYGDCQFLEVNWIGENDWIETRWETFIYHIGTCGRAEFEVAYQRE